jgi:hypothetical protein
LDDEGVTHGLAVSPLLPVNNQVPSECRFEEFLAGAIDIELLKRIALPIWCTVDDGFVVLYDTESCKTTDDITRVARKLEHSSPVLGG